jgi:hypothetical protein
VIDNLIEPDPSENEIGGNKKSNKKVSATFSGTVVATLGGLESAPNDKSLRSNACPGHRSAWASVQNIQ